MKKTLTPISEFRKKYKTVREYPNKEGEIVVRTLEFELADNPSIKNFDHRIFAKLIDVGLYSIFLFGFWFLTGIWFRSFLEIIIGAVLLMVFLNSVLETITGTTIGKTFFALSVINDYGKNPPLWRSLVKNFYSLFMVLFAFRRIPSQSSLIRQNQHCTVVKLYVIKNSDKENIINRIHNYNEIDLIGTETH